MGKTHLASAAAGQDDRASVGSDSSVLKQVRLLTFYTVSKPVF